MSPRRRLCLTISPLLLFLLAAILFISQSHIFPTTTTTAQFAVIIDAGSSGSRAHVFAYTTTRSSQAPSIDLNLTAVKRVGPGISSFSREPARAGESVAQLVEFAKERVGEQGWAHTEVRLMATAGMRLVDAESRERILEECRKVLRDSGFLFEDGWAKVISGSDEGIYAWVAANYALGTLGGDPQKTIGITELGGASVQLTFVSDEQLPMESSHVLTFGKTRYNLYSHSFLHFGQNAAQESLHEFLRSRVSKLSAESAKYRRFDDPCTPKGYSHDPEMSKLNTSKQENVAVGHADGNFTECRSASLMLLQKGKENCKYQQCHLGSTFIPKLQGQFLATENFFFTTKFFGLSRTASLSDLLLAGEQFCNQDWLNLKEKYQHLTEEEPSRYCFSSAYIVALLHDSLGIALDDNRIEFANNVGDIQVEWALGAFIMTTMTKGSERPGAFAATIRNNARLPVVIVTLLVCAAWLVSKWRKPHVKIIYDLEKGRYIVTRLS